MIEELEQDWVKNIPIVSLKVKKSRTEAFPHLLLDLEKQNDYSDDRKEVR